MSEPSNLQFNRISSEFLMYLNKKSLRAENNAMIEQECKMLEQFYTEASKIVESLNLAEYSAKIEGLNYKTKCKILEVELRDVMRELLLASPEAFGRTLTAQKQPKGAMTPRQYKQALERYKNKEIEMSQILDHFTLTDEQILELAKSR